VEPHQTHPVPQTTPGLYSFGCDEPKGTKPPFPNTLRSWTFPAAREGGAGKGSGNPLFDPSPLWRCVSFMDNVTSSFPLYSSCLRVSVHSAALRGRDKTGKNILSETRDNTKHITSRHPFVLLSFSFRCRINDQGPLPQRSAATAVAVEAFLGHTSQTCGRRLRDAFRKMEACVLFYEFYLSF